jgi:aspartyl-tRNA(Asn)/glutamyl-tRNA(Gln) amidotransferase subunit A
MQIAGRPFEDATVLAIGHAFEKAAGLRARRPKLDKASMQADRAA